MRIFINSYARAEHEEFVHWHFEGQDDRRDVHRSTVHRTGAREPYMTVNGQQIFLSRGPFFYNPPANAMFSWLLNGNSSIESPAILETSGSSETPHATGCAT